LNPSPSENNNFDSMTWIEPSNGDRIVIKNSYVVPTYISDYSEQSEGWEYSFSYCASTNEFNAFNDDGTNIVVNPFFCDVAGGDFSLGSNSPLIGADENGANIGSLGVGCGIVNQVLNVPTDYVTIQEAIDASIDGDTVLIHPGIYEGAYLYNKNINLFSLYSTTGDTGYISNTIIDGDDDGCPLMIYGNIDESTHISGFTIQNGTGCVYGQGGGLYIEGSPVVDNMVIKDNNALLNGGGICVNLNSSPTFRDLIVKNNTGELGAGIYVTGSTIDMQNCIISNNSANSNGGGVFIAHAPSGTILENVTITGNTAAESGGGIYCEDSSPSLVNSIVWNNLPEQIEIYSDTAIVTYSDIQGGWEGTGNIDADPLFCNPDSGDYALSDNSPCFGTGYYGVNMGALGVGCGTSNLPPTDFSILEPSNNAQITIDESNLNTGYITFSWGESSDANGDSLYYLMHITSAEIGDHGMDTDATFIDISYIDIIEDMSENNVTAASLEWTVHVTDGIDTVEADNAPFTLQVDGSNALSAYLEGLLPDEFALQQNYPNPFNPVTTLRYDLPINGMVTIIIYDMLGREVKTLINQNQNAGYKSVIWNATNDNGKPISAGIYLYQIHAGEYMQTKKMVLLK
jgi:predicted outer membrane repeat protein